MIGSSIRQGDWLAVMRILDRSVYVGPSQYAHFPVIRLELDLGPLEAWPTGRLGSSFVDALAAALPGLAEHGCSYREPGGFFRRMREAPLRALHWWKMTVFKLHWAGPTGKRFLQTALRRQACCRRWSLLTVLNSMMR